MKPVETEFTNTVFKLPGGTTKNDLPLYRCQDSQGNYLISTWELTDEERKAIAAGAKIELCVWGERHPPVALTVEGVV